jgi:hypothetical protein
MIQFTTSGVEVSASPAELAAARADFDGRKLLHLPGLLSNELAQRVREGLERDGFEEAVPAKQGTPEALYRGVYVPAAADGGGAPRFLPLPEPSAAEAQELAERVAARIDALRRAS